MNPEFQAALFFLPEKDITGINPFGAGNVNDTYIVTLRSNEKRILQRINPSVFPDPHRVTQNMRLVIDHLLLKNKALEAQGEMLRFPHLYKGKSGDVYEDENGFVWRLMNMIVNCRTYNEIENKMQAEELGRALGTFHSLLSTVDPEKLADTLPGFHNTPEYLHHYDSVVSGKNKGNDSDTEFCRLFIEQRRFLVHLLENEKDTLCHSVIHGDPKVANFLFDLQTDKVVSLIDLDTVKPGLLLHDLGDALRSCCNTAGETVAATDMIRFEPELFQAWLCGYCTEAGHLLRTGDRDHIVDSVLVISFELGLRFFTDYIEGNRYFKVRFQDQNLERAMVQFSLVQSIEEQTDLLQSIVNNLTVASQ